MHDRGLDDEATSLLEDFLDLLVRDLHKVKYYESSVSTGDLCNAPSHTVQQSPGLLS